MEQRWHLSQQLRILYRLHYDVHIILPLFRPRLLAREGNATHLRREASMLLLLHEKLWKEEK